MVLRGAFRQVAIGLVIGGVLALVAGRLISNQLFEVKGHDPTALVGAALLLAVFALIAGFLPAHRAARPCTACHPSSVGGLPTIRPVIWNDRTPGPLGSRTANHWNNS